MNLATLVLCLAISDTPQDAITAVAKDTGKLNNLKSVRYLTLYDVEDEKERERYKAVVSFVLNSVSKERSITIPIFTDDSKRLIRFNLDDYGLKKSGYDSLGKSKVLESEVLNKILDCENPLLRADDFIIKALAPFSYYKLIQVSNLSEFRERVAYDKEKIGEQGALVDGLVARQFTQVRRLPTDFGYIWESRQSKSDYLKDLINEKFDFVQIVASNPNGLLSYLIADQNGKLQECVDVESGMDSSRTLDDVKIKVSRNCIFCHAAKGVVPFKDTIRQLTNVNIVAKDDKVMERLKALYGSDLPFKNDVKQYQHSLKVATDMDPYDFQKSIIAVFKNYYADLTLKQVANYLGKSEKEFTEYCRNSQDIYWLKLVFDGKLSRISFDELRKE